MRRHDCFDVNVDLSGQCVMLEHRFHEPACTFMGFADDFETRVRRRSHDRREWVDGETYATEAPTECATQIQKAQMQARRSFDTRDTSCCSHR